MFALVGRLLLLVGAVAGAADSTSSDFNGRAEHQTDQVGYYHVITTGRGAGGAFPTGEAYPEGATFRFVTDDPDWDLPIQAWQYRDWFPPTTTLAMTMWSDDTLLYVNHGIEDGQTGTFYRARLDASGAPTLFAPGLSSFFSMSNNYDMIYAGAFRLEEPITFNRISGYFACVDGFDPNDFRVGFRMNIWTAAVRPENPEIPLPEIDSFTGNVFSTETVRGKFEYVKTGVERDWTELERDARPIWRLTYALEEPLTLPAGDYFFSHDAVLNHLLVPFYLVPAVGLPFLLPGSATTTALGFPFVPIVPPRWEPPSRDGSIVVPEPATMILVGAGAALLALRVVCARHRKRSTGEATIRE